MIRLLFYVAVASALCRLATGRWPWQLLGFKSIRELSWPAGRSAESARARALLGVGRHADRDEIISAHKRLIAAVHPDRGGTAELVYEANAARDRLLAEVVPD